MGNDEMQVEFLPDGRVKVETDEISSTNHTTAEKFIAELGRLMGGDVVRTRKTAKVVQGHTHIHIGGG